MARSWFNKNIMRQFLPRRWSEFIALISLSTTLFLFIQTRDLARHEEEGDTKEIVEDILTAEQYETRYGKVSI